MRAFVLVVALAACKQAPDGGTCDPAKPPSAAWAYAQNLAAGGEKVGTLGPDALSLVRGTTDVYELSQNECCDRGSVFMGHFYRCKRYMDERLLIHDILLARGWAAADATKRTALAFEVVELFGLTLREKPKYGWDTTHEFAPPVAAPGANGSVEITHWTQEVVGGEDPRTSYVQQKLVVSAEGTLGKADELARFARVKPN